MMIHSRQNNEFKITSNKAILEYAREQAQGAEKMIKTLKLINHVRIFKQVFLPCELVGSSGRDQTEASIYNYKMNQLKWIFYYYHIE